MPPSQDARHLAYWQSEISYSLTKSGIIDQLGKAPSKCAAVATALGLVSDLTCRMMSAGEGVKLLSAADDGTYSLTGAGDMLRADHPGSLRDFMLMINEESST
jgi:hypothetical protein